MGSKAPIISVSVKLGIFVFIPPKKNESGGYNQLFSYLRFNFFADDN